MKVKVGDTVYTDEEVPIMVILSETDKNNIRDMLSANYKYASAPDEYFDNSNDFLRWMREGIDEPITRSAT